jgi:tetratricopeptide (TPR) repeat protein
MPAQAQFNEAMQSATQYMQQQDYAAAAECFVQATKLDPDHAQAFYGLSHALHKLHNNTDAAAAYGNYLKRSDKPATLEDVGLLRELGDLKNARIECGRILGREPENLKAMRQLAMIAAEQGRSAEAEQLLARILELAPEALPPIKDLARLCNDQHRFMEACQWYRKALEIDPNNSELQLALANALLIVGQAEAAQQAFSACYTLDPRNHVARLGEGHALRALGRTNEAQQAYRQCQQRDSLFADASWALASMRNYHFDEDGLAALLTHRNQASISDHDASCLDFSIASQLDERAQFDEAWDYYEKGNARRRQAVQYDPVVFETRVDQLIEFHTADYCQTGINPAQAEVIPIFIVGMPRSGSTLLEQILASHSQVESTTELPYLENLARQDHGVRDTSAAGAEYLASCAAHHSGQVRYFIDKLPDNFLNIGLINKILPQAIVIDARRDPLDTCVANFRQLYASGKDYSYDLLELGERYLQYHRLMQHWHEVLPGRVLTVPYEAVVGETETQIRGLLQHCGLDWEDNCLSFNETRRTITTPSSEQVRQPIYASSIGCWRRYQARLEELIDTLEPLLD